MAFSVTNVIRRIFKAPPCEVVARTKGKGIGTSPSGSQQATHCTCMRAQAAGLCGFSGFKSESALRLGKAESRSLAARVAVQATTVSPESLQHAASIS